MSLIHNERTKLSATYLNGMAIAVFAIGGLAPLFSTVYEDRLFSPILASAALICLILSAALHYLARRILGGLKQ